VHDLPDNARGQILCRQLCSCLVHRPPLPVD
jgi:hypothetical protein